MSKKDTIDYNLSGHWENPLTEFYKNGGVAIAFARFNGDIVDANFSFLDLFGFSKKNCIQGN